MKTARRLLSNLINASFLLATLCLLVFSVAGYFGELNHWIDLTSHFKVQYLLLSLIPITFFALKRYKIGLILSLLCLFLNLIEVAPWYLPRFISTADLPAVRVFFSNIDKYQSQHEKVVAVTQSEQPNVAVFVEVGKESAKVLTQLQAQFPYVFAHQDVETDGTTIYSQFPLLNPEVKSLGGGRKAVIVEMKIQNQPVVLIAVHPSNAVGQEYVEERNRQLDAIAAEIRSRQGPIILAGDLNTTPWSPHYKRSLGKTQLFNARRGFGILPTWEIIHPFFAIPIDHILLTQNIKVAHLHRAASVGSDHLPLVADLHIGG
jgi:endonuclease/exonuclease/phosphatase (EEP) superfamily protein YafD